MGIKLPGDESGKSEKLRIEELKSESKKYESNAKAYIETIALAKEVLKTIQKYKDAEMAETEWAGKNQVEITKLEKALTDLEKEREINKPKLKEIDYQREKWPEVKRIIRGEYDLTKSMPPGEERRRLMHDLISVLDKI